MKPPFPLHWALWALIASGVLLIIYIWTVFYSVHRDCANPYESDMQLFVINISVTVWSDKEGCETPATIL